MAEGRLQELLRALAGWAEGEARSDPETAEYFDHLYGETPRPWGERDALEAMTSNGRTLFRNLLGHGPYTALEELRKYCARRHRGESDARAALPRAAEVARRVHQVLAGRGNAADASRWRALADELGGGAAAPVRPGPAPARASSPPSSSLPRSEPPSDPLAAAAASLRRASPPPSSAYLPPPAPNPRPPSAFASAGAGSGARPSPPPFSPYPLPSPPPDPASDPLAAAAAASQRAQPSPPPQAGPSVPRRAVVRRRETGTRPASPPPSLLSRVRLRDDCELDEAPEQQQAGGGYAFAASAKRQRSSDPGPGYTPAASSSPPPPFAPVNAAPSPTPPRPAPSSSPQPPSSDPLASAFAAAPRPTRSRTPPALPVPLGMDSEADGPTPVPPASEDDETVHIVLDGCNIAFEHGIAAGGALSGERRRFSAQGIRLALDYFRKKWGARAVAFLPRRHLEKFDTPGDALLLADMASRGEVARVPSGADDDRAMLRFAHALDAVIVSNDMYRDHVEDLASDPEAASLGVLST
eukprot:tig00020563_g11221.t1